MHTERLSSTSAWIDALEPRHKTAFDCVAAGTSAGTGPEHGLSGAQPAGTCAAARSGVGSPCVVTLQCRSAASSRSGTFCSSLSAIKFPSSANACTFSFCTLVLSLYLLLWSTCMHFGRPQCGSRVFLPPRIVVPFAARVQFLFSQCCSCSCSCVPCVTLLLLSAD